MPSKIYCHQKYVIQCAAIKLLAGAAKESEAQTKHIQNFEVSKDSWYGKTKWKRTKNRIQECCVISQSFSTSLWYFHCWLRHRWYTFHCFLSGVTTKRTHTTTKRDGFSGFHYNIVAHFLLHQNFSLLQKLQHNSHTPYCKISWKNMWLSKTVFCTNSLLYF